MPSVSGWLDASSAVIIGSIHSIQADLGIVGAVAEIGVHHGKLFIVLALGLDRSEKGLAIDLFSRQAENIDRSGRGDKQKFLANLQRFGVSTEALVILEANSLELEAADILAHVDGTRLFSVDGGHTEEFALHDLELADRSCVDGGVIILDDVFNERWPGVITGLTKYKQTGGSMNPFAILPNKILMCRQEWFQIYQQKLQQMAGSYYLKRSEMFGSSVAVYSSAPLAPWEELRGLKRSLKRVMHSLGA